MAASHLHSFSFSFSSLLVLFLFSPHPPPSISASTTYFDADFTTSTVTGSVTSTMSDPVGVGSGGTYDTNGYTFVTNQYTLNSQSFTGPSVLPIEIICTFTLTTFPTLAGMTNFIYVSATPNGYGQFLMYIKNDGHVIFEANAAGNQANIDAGGVTGSMFEPNIDESNQFLAVSNLILTLNQLTTLTQVWYSDHMILTDNFGFTQLIPYTGDGRLPNDPSFTLDYSIGTGLINIGDTFGTGLEGTITAFTIKGATEAGGNGDPQFVGFHGQNYQIHGYPDTWFNIISSLYFKVNAKFTYLATGTCTYNNTQCWTHPGTYMDTFGIMLSASDTDVNNNSNNNNSTRLSIVAGSHTAGLTVTVNGVPVPIGSSTIYSCPMSMSVSMSISRPSFDHLHLRAGPFHLDFYNADEFINIRASLAHDIIQAGNKYVDMNKITGYKTPSMCKQGIYPDIQIHGLLGQTWRNAVYAGNHLYEGTVDDYVCSAQFIYDSVFNAN